MDYEKKYNDALEWARKVMQGKVGFVLDEVLEKFPELKESEDEKIREDIISYLALYKDAIGEEYESWITWLEKQCEQKAWTEEDKKMLKWVTGYLENKMLNTPMGEERTACKNAIVWFKKLEGEHKPADKVEPKFHEGEWVFVEEVKGYKNGPFQIKTMDSFGYSFDEYHTIPFMYEDLLSNWTIQDAKDGDVLCTYEGVKPKIVFILKGTPKKNYALSYYCFYNIMYPSFETDEKEGCLGPRDEDVKPATKEQRDLLFQKMKEAGYEWDAEKKELRKINSYCEKHCKGYRETGKCFADSDCKAKREAEQKPTWSEEDNIILSRIISDYERSNEEWFNAQKSLPHGRKITWLKSLKDRVQLQPKQGWNDKDEKHLNRAINVLNASKIYTTSPDKYEDTINWLKSLRYRLQWKPSIFHLECITDAISMCKERGITVIGLKEILDELKKLREE